MRMDIDTQAAEGWLATAAPDKHTAPLWTYAMACQYDGMRYGVEQEAANLDAIARESLGLCDVCEGAYHLRDLAPCGPADLACPSCREAWEELDEP